MLETTQAFLSLRHTAKVPSYLDLPQAKTRCDMARHPYAGISRRLQSLALTSPSSTHMGSPPRVDKGYHGATASATLGTQHTLLPHLMGCSSPGQGQAFSARSSGLLQRGSTGMLDAQWPPGSSELGDGAREGSERTYTASLGVLLLLGWGQKRADPGGY